MHRPSIPFRGASTGAAAILAALFLVTAPCAAQVVSGTVVADGSGLPLAGARVALQSLDGSRAAVVAVDATGLFLLTAPAPGCYRLSVVVGDEVTLATDLSLGPGDTLSYHLSVVDPGRVAGAATTPVEGVVGRVVDAVDGQPVSGVSVSLSGVARRTVTDAHGRFHAPLVPPGIRRVTVERAGYLPLTDSVEVGTEEVLEMDISLHPDGGAVQRLLTSGDGSVTGKRDPGFRRATLSADDLEASLLRDLQTILRSRAPHPPGAPAAATPSGGCSG